MGKRIFLWLWAAAGILTVAPVSAQQEGTAELPAALTSVAFRDQYRNVRRLSDFQGRLVVVNFWATWCGPCVEEMPALNRLQKDYRGRLKVVAISQDHVEEGGDLAVAIREFYTDRQLGALDIYYDELSGAMRAFGFVGLPSTVILSRRGEEIDRYTGFVDWDDPELRKKLEKWM